VPYCIDLIGSSYIETNAAVMKAFRPRSEEHRVGTECRFVRCDYPGKKLVQRLDLLVQGRQEGQKRRDFCGEMHWQPEILDASSEDLATRAGYPDPFPTQE